MRVKNLSAVFPLLAIEHGCLLSKQGDISIAWKVRLPELFTLSDEEYEALHQAWVKAVRNLPAGMVVHKQDWFTEAAYIADLEKEQGFLSAASERFFHERPYLDHHCYVILTRRAPDRKEVNSLFSGLLRRQIVPAQTLDPLQLQAFQHTAGQFAQLLCDSGFLELEQLDDKALAGDAARVGIAEAYLQLRPMGALPLLQDIAFHDGLRVGGQYCRLFTLADAADLPAYCGARINYDRYSTDKSAFAIGFAAPLGLLLPCNHIYNQYIFTGDVPRAIRRLESRRLRLQSLAAYSRENAVARDATNAFLQEAVSQQRIPVKAHFNILVWTEDKERLKDLQNLVSTALSRMDAVPKQELDGAPQLFWAGIPGNAGDFPMNDSFDTFAEQACCFLHMETSYRSSVSPCGIRLGDRLSGRPLHVDISDEPMKRGYITNRNKFILGPSGSGKSFFTNHMLRSYYEQGSHIVLVDVGHSYRGLCSLLKGYYFTYDEQHPICFNPFYMTDGQLPDTEKKESIKTLLLALWKKDTESFRRSEYVALSNALTGYYVMLGENPEIFPCFNSFYEYLQHGFREVLEKEKVRDRDFDMANFLYVLRPYAAGGEFDYLLNARENLDLLEERLIVFELDNIKDHPILFPVVTIIIMETFIAKMRRLKGIRKIILIEEAWKAIAREGMAEYIRYLFKTVRKFYGEAIVVTQEVEDIISSPVVKQAIINNADCKILLDQSKYQNKFDQVQELLGLTHKEKALVLSINRANDPLRRYKEVFISLGGVVSKVYRVEVSAAEYLAYTTEEKEKLQLQELADQHGGQLEKAISILAEEKR